jgi:hypothetical protein
LKDYTKWTRTNLELPGQPSVSDTDPARRKEAERQTNNDLQKPIQQLICDVHEESGTPTMAMDQRLVQSHKRMVSMLGRVALEHEDVGKEVVQLTRTLVVLTRWLVGFTVCLAILTIVLIIEGVVPLFHR